MEAQPVQETAVAPRGSLLASPLRLFKLVAAAEAVTWTLLLIGMFLKYVTDTTELGVRVFGMMHGVVFVSYCVVTVVVAVDRRWSLGRLVLGLLSAVPPFMTLWFERYAERRDLLADSWRLARDEPAGALDQVAARLIRHPGLGVLVGLVAIALLTTVALIVGPPGG